MLIEPSFAIEPLLTRVPWCQREVLLSLVGLAGEIASEGNEGRSLGTLFTVGHAERVLEHSRALILDPLQGHVPHATHIKDPRLRGTLKELALLDGAFVVADDGTVVAACRYLDVLTERVHVPFGLGSRHLVAAAASKELEVIAIVVSQTGVIRAFYDGELLGEGHAVG